MTAGAEMRAEERRRPAWRELWPALAAAGASVAFHAAHMVAVLAAAGASHLAHAHHANHGGGASGGAETLAWLSWLGWGVNGITLLLAGHLLVSYIRHRRTDRRKAASHLVVCLVSFVIAFATIALSLS